MLFKLMESRLWAIVLPVVAVGLLLVATAVFEPVRDDYFHRQLLTADMSAPHAAQSLFSFSRSLDDFATLKRDGYVPWWVSDQLQLNFWRPLAALTHWIDYQLWPDSWVAMHLQNIFWFMVSCLLFGLLVDQLGGRGLVLWLAMLIYAFDPNHFVAIGWIANRNILIATCFGLAALLALQRWNQSSRLFFLLLTALLYACALLAAEGGVATLGLLMVFLLVFQTQPISARFAVLAILMGVTVVWRVVYETLDYGAKSTAMYLDPIGQFPEFLAQLWVNGSTLLFEQISRVPTYAMSLSPSVLTVQVWINITVLMLLVLLLLPLLKRQKLALFGLLGGTIAVIPMCASAITGGRLLIIPGVGLSLFMAVWYGAVLSGTGVFAKHKMHLFLLKAVTFISVGVVALTTVLGWYYKAEASLVRSYGSLPPHINILSDDRAHKNLLLINPPVFFDLMYLPLMADYFGLSQPEKILSLVPGRTSFQIQVVGDSTLLVSNASGLLVNSTAPWYQTHQAPLHRAFLYRRADSFFGSAAMTVNTSFTTSLATIVIEEVNAEQDPTRIKVLLNVPLTDPHWVVLYWDWQAGQFKPVVAMPPQLEIAGPFDSADQG